MGRKPTVEGILEHEIDAVATVCIQSVPEVFESVKEYIHIPVADARRVDSDNMQTIAIWAANAWHRDMNVLIHCMQGRNRSVTIAAMTLMRIKNITSEQALLQVREARPNCIANPNLEEFLLSL